MASEKNRDNAKVISPLRQMLMGSSIDGMIRYLHQMKIQFNLTRDAGGTYHVNIFRDGMLRYKSSSGKSAKSAMADSLALFLINEQKDFHSYLRKVG